VTGAAGGIGTAVAQRLAQHPGVTVVGLDRVAAESDSSLDVIGCDLSHDQERERTLDELFVRLGAPAYWVSCAGTYPRVALEDYDRDLFDEVLADNLGHVFWVARRVVASMRDGGGGRIVLVSSQAAAAGGHDAAYAAAKAGVTALAKSIAREHAAAGILCNAVSPGPTDTPMAEAMGSWRTHYMETMPIKRLVTADEAAEVICAVLTLRGSALTGATVDVDGGLLRR
jgi:3-oxoacyl-[acyl-carrier protein] reductase